MRVYNHVSGQATFLVTKLHINESTMDCCETVEPSDFSLNGEYRSKLGHAPVIPCKKVSDVGC